MQYVQLLSERARQVFETTGFFHSFQITGKIVEYTTEFARMNDICRKTNSKGAEMKTLNARPRIGFMGTKEVQFHWLTPSENWLCLGQSTLRKLCSSAAAVLHVG